MIYFYSSLFIKCLEVKTVKNQLFKRAICLLTLCLYTTFCSNSANLGGSSYDTNEQRLSAIIKSAVDIGGLKISEGAVSNGTQSSPYIPKGKSVENRGILNSSKPIFIEGELHNYGILEASNDTYTQIGSAGKIYNYFSMVPDTKYTSTLTSSVFDELFNKRKIDKFYMLKKGAINGKVVDGKNTIIYDNGFPNNLGSQNSIFDGVLDNVVQLKETDAIFINENSKIKLENFQHNGEFKASLYSIYEYVNGQKDVIPVNPKVIVEKTNESAMLITGDYSWYNGVFNLEKGVVTVGKDAALFGGDINLSANTKLIIKGGTKDQFNKPNIKMQDYSEVHFDSPNGLNDVFSFYGSITGDENSIISFNSGTVIIKGDCSNFKGTIKMKAGAKLIIREKTGQYQGKMFGGKLMVVDEQGNPGGEITIDSKSGLSPLRILSGSVKIIKDDTPTQNTQHIIKEVDEIISFNESHVFIDYADPKLNNTSIHGSLTLLNGKTATFNNLNIDGGMLNVEGEHLETIKINGSFKVGSGINLMKNNIIDTIDASNAEKIEVYPGRNFHYYCTFDPKSRTVDNIIAKTCSFSDGSALEIMDCNTISELTEKSYVFQILKLTDSNGKYLPIKISSKKYISGKLGRYELCAEGGPGCVTLRCIDDIPLQKLNCSFSGLSSEAAETKSYRNILTNNTYIPQQKEKLSITRSSTPIYPEELHQKPYITTLKNEPSNRNFKVLSSMPKYIMENSTFLHSKKNVQEQEIFDISSEVDYTFQKNSFKMNFKNQLKKVNQFFTNRKILNKLPIETDSKPLGKFYITKKEDQSLFQNHLQSLRMRRRNYKLTISDD